MSVHSICEHGIPSVDDTCPDCLMDVYPEACTALIERALRANGGSATQTQTDREIAAEAVLVAIRREYTRARVKHAPLNSGHEAVGVIDEEVTEFKDAVYFGVDRHGRPANPATEAVQVAAMALAYVVEAFSTWEYKDGR